ncbi:MAG: DUF3883 domain-containing protein [bacterium]|nr:DUF3883 domain-containing protein [bacterium]
MFAIFRSQQTCGVPHLTSPDDRRLTQLLSAAARGWRIAITTTTALQRSLGRDPVKMPHNNKGFDIDSRNHHGRILTIEVKGRVTGARDFSITRSEIICALNKADRHILALVEVADDDTTSVRYLYDPFTNREPEPSPAEHKRTLDWKTYWELGGAPS